MMPHKDTELDVLGDAREQARNVRTEWKEYLDSCHERLSALHDENDSRIDGLSREGDELYNQMVDSVTRSTECYGSGDHRGAREWSARGKALKARLAAVNDEKNGLIAQIKEARAKFNDARENYRNVKAAHEAAQRAFDDRLAEVRRKRAAKAEARARRMTAKVPDLVSEAERKAIKKHRKRFNFAMTTSG
jgi:chromosome segregation ATPase